MLIITISDRISSPPALITEQFPIGGGINMGVYRRTIEARSKSYFSEPVCKTIVVGDINGDCKINVLDFRLIGSHWLIDENR